jgi:hypothetical protein
MRNRKKGPSKSKGQEGFGDFIVLGFAFGVPLFIRLGLTYLRFKRQAKKAGKVFRKELLKSGMDKDTVKVLTEEYMTTSEFIINSVRQWRAARS